RRTTDGGIYLPYRVENWLGPVREMTLHDDAITLTGLGIAHDPLASLRNLAYAPPSASSRWGEGTPAGSACQTATVPLRPAPGPMPLTCREGNRRTGWRSSNRASHARNNGTRCCISSPARRPNPNPSGGPSGTVRGSTGWLCPCSGLGQA